MWCIPKVTPQFIERMEHILNLYAKPYNPKEPLLCFDEKSKQLLEDTRMSLPLKPGASLRRDYAYKRNGVRNIFLAVEPKGGFRTTSITTHRKKSDFAHEIKRIHNLPRYRTVRTLHIVLDNLNTHFEQSLTETLGTGKAKRLMRRITFHYTPTHASWLNMAEIEISIMGRQCVNGRIPTESILKERIRLWQRQRNMKKATISWRFTRQDARRAFKYNKGSKLS